MEFTNDKTKATIKSRKQLYLYASKLLTISIDKSKALVWTGAATKNDTILIFDNLANTPLTEIRKVLTESGEDLTKVTIKDIIMNLVKRSSKLMEKEYKKEQAVKKQKVYRKKWASKNEDKLKALRKVWTENNKDKLKKQRKEWKKNNKAKLLKLQEEENIRKIKEFGRK